MTFESMDANGDKSLSKDELAAHPVLLAQFEAVDKDKSGTLSQEEFLSFRQEKQAAKFNK